MGKWVKYPHHYWRTGLTGLLIALVAFGWGLGAQTYFANEPVAMIDEVVAQECFIGWVSETGFFAPLAWAHFSNIGDEGRIFLCTQGQLKLTSVPEGAIINLPRFDGALELIEANEQLIRDNRAMRVWIGEARIQLEELN